jgi:hypothetical protein
MEYRITQHVGNGHDFYEGVRAGKYLLNYLTNNKKKFILFYLSID